MKTSRHEVNLAYLALTGRLSKTERSGESALKPSQYPKQKFRAIGASLKSSEVPALVEAALSSGGPIQQGEQYEHFLAVQNDDKWFYAFHFIIAPARDGGRRRAILLSDRTVNGLNDNHLQTLAYATRLTQYAAALGTPRVVIEDMSACCFLMHSLRHDLPKSMDWSASRLHWPPTDDALRAAYEDNYALAFDRYRQALAARSVQHPLPGVLADQVSSVSPRSDNAVMALNQPLIRMGRELGALCQVYLDEDNERLEAAFGRDFPSHFSPLFG